VRARFGKLGLTLKPDGPRIGDIRELTPQGAHYVTGHGVHTPMSCTGRVGWPLIAMCVREDDSSLMRSFQDYMCSLITRSFMSYSLIYLQEI
jgi:hypothetical protein